MSSETKNVVGWRASDGRMWCTRCWGHIPLDLRPPPFPFATLRDTVDPILEDHARFPIPHCIVCGQELKIISAHVRMQHANARLTEIVVALEEPMDEAIALVDALRTWSGTCDDGIRVIVDRLDERIDAMAGEREEAREFCAELYSLVGGNDD
jgi:hypothetical protein